MGDCESQLYVKISNKKCILRSELLSLLKTYNCYHEGKSFQLRHHEDVGGLVVEGLLNISWGLRRPIRLQMYDSNERIFFSSCDSWCRDSQGKDRLPLSITEQQSSEEENNNAPERSVLSDPKEEEITPQLKRTRSDASFVQRRSHHRSPAEAQRLRTHRFSINGHFYNHKTSVFTPAYGSVTNVRVTSTMNTLEVLNLLLRKFRVENSSSEFGLYLVHENGERTRLGDNEFPLICRILHGPCERIAKLFLMETDLGEEVSHDVAQYIKFEMPVLDSFVEKLKEEEEREIYKLTQRYNAVRMMLLERLDQLTNYESFA
ncbi:ras association domain-containing protein 4 [Hyla sarda]|uniref:ras association domain-containing protein 4 n=1 Tax=Hyla sarda TaxID=327740 RepID=UPI0024C2924A|nr:ras association domain-containing protein 4 [Hyla sarda]XP_056387209.1 ras association domain-containing protein 4 [Hyla sarda]XP_056387210.1 ras association domain-containing protein 4 [Hyla sarda]XP_056387211.1 ras association domain-containing protein 4 [Hyla sarda]XP_056387212.1 ras association domain-containing protein 4 [Hyla sarda]